MSDSKRNVIIDQSDMYTNVFEVFEDDEVCMQILCLLTITGLSWIFMPYYTSQSLCQTVLNYTAVFPQALGLKYLFLFLKPLSRH